MRLVCVLALLLSLGACGKPAKQAATRKKKPKDDHYAFGQVVHFSQHGDAGRYTRGGWGEPEDEATWTVAPAVKLIMTVPESDQPLRIRMRLEGFTVPPALPFQPVQVLVNDEVVAEWRVPAEVDDYTAIIPPTLNVHEQMFVELRMPRSASPSTLEVGHDARTLGVKCYELCVTEANSGEAAAERLYTPGSILLGTEYAFGDIIRFGAGAGSQRFKKYGWHIAEPGYTWTGREPALLELTIPSTELPLVLKMNLSGMVDEELPSQLAQIYVNGQKIADWDVRGWETCDALIPKEISTRGGRIEIEVRTPWAASPESFGFGPDNRFLGVRCESMVIEELDEMFQPKPKSRPSPSPSPSSRRRNAPPVRSSR